MLVNSMGKKGFSGLGGSGMMFGKLFRALAFIFAPTLGLLASMLTVLEVRLAGIQICLRS